MTSRKITSYLQLSMRIIACSASCAKSMVLANLCSASFIWMRTGRLSSTTRNLDCPGEAGCGRADSRATRISVVDPRAAAVIPDVVPEPDVGVLSISGSMITAISVAPLVGGAPVAADVPTAVAPADVDFGGGAMTTVAMYCVAAD